MIRYLLQQNRKLWSMSHLCLLAMRISRTSTSFQKTDNREGSTGRVKYWMRLRIPKRLERRLDLGQKFGHGKPADLPKRNTQLHLSHGVTYRNSKEKHSVTSLTSSEKRKVRICPGTPVPVMMNLRTSRLLAAHGTNTLMEELWEDILLKHFFCVKDGVL